MHPAFLAEKPLTSTLDLNLPQERLADPNMADYILIFIHLGPTIGGAGTSDKASDRCALPPRSLAHPQKPFDLCLYLTIRFLLSVHTGCGCYTFVLPGNVQPAPAAAAMVFLRARTRRRALRLHSAILRF